MKHTITLIAALIAAPAYATYDEPPKPEHRAQQEQNVSAGASVFSSPSSTSQGVGKADSASGASVNSNDRSLYLAPGGISMSGHCLETESRGWGIAAVRENSGAFYITPANKINMECIRESRVRSPHEIADERCKANEAYAACVREVMSAIMLAPIRRDAAAVEEKAIDLKPAAVIAKPPKKRTAVAGKSVAAQKCGATEVLRCVPRGM